MSDFGKSLKPVNVDRLIDFVKTEIKRKPKRYRPKMTEEERARRQRKARYEWYQRERNTHGYTVYYDRYRKGWFYRDVFGNKYGRYGSKDKGFDSRDKAINAIQRKHRKLQKQMREQAEAEIKDAVRADLIPYDAYPDPEPIPEFDEVIVEYDAYCNKCRRDCYGSKAPSGCLYLKFFNEFVEEKPKIDIGGWTRRQLEEEDGNFSITLMLSYQELQPVYENIDGVEYVVGLEDL